MKALGILFGLVLLAMAGCTPPPPTGAELFADYCAACHGADAKGTSGSLAEHWPKPPSDLTTLSKRHSGTFPMRYVMSTIDGYTRTSVHDDTTMPQFGPLLEGDMAVWTDEDGVPTPTPTALLEVASYLEMIQH